MAKTELLAGESIYGNSIFPQRNLRLNSLRQAPYLRDPQWNCYVSRRMKTQGSATIKYPIDISPKIPHSFLRIRFEGQRRAGKRIGNLWRLDPALSRKHHKSQEGKKPRNVGRRWQNIFNNVERPRALEFSVLASAQRSEFKGSWRFAVVTGSVVTNASDNARPTNVAFFTRVKTIRFNQGRGNIPSALRLTCEGAFLVGKYSFFAFVALRTNFMEIVTWWNFSGGKWRDLVWSGKIYKDLFEQTDL